MAATMAKNIVAINTASPLCFSMNTMPMHVVNNPLIRATMPYFVLAFITTTIDLLIQLMERGCLKISLAIKGNLYRKPHDLCSSFLA
jgi:hypothetical protein